MKVWGAIAVIFGLLGGASSANADRMPIVENTQLPVCAHASVLGAGGIVVDGLLDDWAAIKGAHTDAGDAAGFDVRCAYDDTSLAIAVNVRDAHVVRVAKGPANEDWIEIDLGRGASALKLALYPGNALAKPRRLLNGGAVPKWLSAEDSLQPKGFSVELVIPLAKIPGYSSNIANLPARIRFHDSDAATSKPGEPIAMMGALGLSEKIDLLHDFLKSIGGDPKDVTLDVTTRLDPSRKDQQRVVAIGTVIGVLTDQFAYTTLAVASAADVRKVELIDLRGDGTRVIAATVRQRIDFGTSLGTRDLLMLFSVSGGQLDPIEPIELRKSQGSNVLESTWKLQKHGHRFDLIVTAKDAVGWNASNYNEEPATDAAPINLPWDDARSSTMYWLDGGSMQSRALPKAKH